MIKVILNFASSFLIIASVILFFFAIFNLTKKSTTSRKKFSEVAANYRLKNSKIQYFNQDVINAKLNALGATYAFHGKLTPMVYIGIKFGAAILLFILGLVLGNFIIAIFCGVAGFFGLDLLLSASNKSDNKKMTPDILAFFSVLKNQALSGISIASALAEGYALVKHPRLKSALIELSSKILAHQDFEQSIDEFNGQFSNVTISSFCTVLKQSQDSGKASKLLGDLTNQINDIQSGIRLKKANAQEMKTAFMNVLIFVGFIAAIIYYLVSQTDFSAIL